MMVACTCDPSTQETEAGDCCKFKTSLGHAVEGPCLENKQTKQRQENLRTCNKVL